MYNNTIIEIQNDSVLVTYMSSKEDGTTSSTVLTLHDFIEIVKSADTKMETPVFSTSTFKYKLEGANESLFLFSPPSRVTLKYHGYNGVETFDNAYFPSFYIEAYFNTNGRFSGASIRMLKEVYSITELVSKGTKFKDYKMIFPNVYDGNKVCWGQTLYDVNITRENADNLLEIFRSSIFNNDLFGTSLNRISGLMPNIATIPDYFRWLTTIDTLPDEFYF